MNARKRHSVPSWLMAATALLAISAIAMALWLARKGSEHATALGRLEAENRELRKQVDLLGQQRQTPGGPPSEPPPPAGRPAADRPGGVSHAVQEPSPGSRAEEFQASLASAKATIERLEARIQELDEYTQKVSEENKRIAASEGELSESLAVTRRVVDAVQAELKSKTDRLIQLEIANKGLRDAAGATSEKLARASQAAREMEEINRRRENSVTNLLRRFRELTDQYRGVAARLDNPQETARPAPGELSRIQTAVSMAEDDLRQLSALNAQAQRIQQQIPAR